ncbi:MAG TPA: phosphoglucomutase [Mesotoga infera]|jgi:phosphoglucomutase|uniref:Phosphoglucomutase n=1 Tax=Mesotoga infera TaxID=1236046 RepID=A0A117M8S8_9BACT|nr:MAG: Phosphomannomutase [Mesotoga infera]KUK90699.1 MAG: Phosphomannomutase [Mesotoga infera]HCO70333.1 phosphoglucomutase [Mesotoga infera]
MDYKSSYQRWLDSPAIDEDTRKELLSIAENETEIKERFYKELEFGTAGLRGKLGAGDNRMNKYTVARATQGLANLILSGNSEWRERGVVIAHDSRHMSRTFAEIAAAVLTANDIKVYLFDDIRPTPLLSFSVLELSTISGIMITASHNPKEYNGYKLYWEDGAQVLSNIADRVYEEMRSTELFDGPRMIELDEARTKGLLVEVGEELDDLYISKVLSLTLRDSEEELDKSIRIVYTPLNGTGNVPVRRVLRERGFKNVFVVPEQEGPDPDFSTVGYPNPEDPKAFALAREVGLEKRADILLATDPDADRLAVMVRKNDDFVPLNGNQTGALLVNYLLRSMKEKSSLPRDGFIVKSIVTGDMAKTIADNYGVKTYETLTGFKNICGKALEIEDRREGKFIFGYEESIGYVAGNFVRDKDAVSSSMLLCEMAAYFLKRGKTLLNVLDELFVKYGVFTEKQISMVLEGVQGQKRVRKIMKEYRKEYPTEIGDSKLVKYIDFLSSTATDILSGRTVETGTPASDVIKFLFDDGSWYAIRPSGTEPKLKIYIYTRAKERDEAFVRLEGIEKSVLGKIQSI